MKIVLKDSYAGAADEVIFKKFLKACVFLASSHLTYVFPKAGESTDRKDLKHPQQLKTQTIFLQVSLVKRQNCVQMQQ